MFDASSPNLALFAGAVVVMLIVDLLLFRASTSAPSLRRAAAWSALWVTVSVAFGAGVWAKLGSRAAAEFLTAYVLEKTLSVDNVFVFVLIFGAFAVPPAHQQRILFWGVLGAIVLRAVFIVAGAAALAKAHFVIYVFGGLLIATAAKIALSKDDHTKRAGDTQLVRWLNRLFRVSPASGRDFFVRDERGRHAVTPLFLALLAVAFTDVVFAVDSIPAVFAVSRDPFIVLTSNVFAVLGLRALYFLLASSFSRFVYLRYGLAIVLAFVGLKMCLSNVLTVSPLVSLGVVSMVLATTIGLSLWRTRATQHEVLSCN